MECYVYALKEPDTEEVFYIGKGTGYRAWAHLKPSMWKNPRNTCNPFLYYKIKSIFDDGKQPEVEILFDNITEEHAYSIEADLISQHGRRFVDGGSLFNISDYSGGNRKGKSIVWSEERKNAHRNYWKDKRVVDDPDEIRRMYVDQNMTRLEIAEYYGVSESLIKNRLREYSITKSRDVVYEKIKEKSRTERVCSVCLSKFLVVKSSSKKYCSRNCADVGRRRRIVFKDVEYDSIQDAHEKTKYSKGYISNVCTRL